LFSSHLSNINKDLDASIEIITLHKALQIYKPEGRVGPNFEDYRDCIDIAVKLAFGLNVTKPDINLIQLKEGKENSIITLEAAQLISNQSKFDSTFPKIKQPVRIKQNSDVQISKVFSVVENIIDRNLNIITQYNKLMSHEYAGTYLNILKTNIAPKEELEALVYHNMNYMKCLTDSLNNDASDLIGVIEKLFQ
jgi:hypothetical protein